MKALSGRRGIALVILNLSTGWRWVVIVIVIYLAFHKIHTDIEAVINKIN
jgi:hypothetical protein